MKKLFYVMIAAVSAIIFMTAVSGVDLFPVLSEFIQNPYIIGISFATAAIIAAPDAESILFEKIKGQIAEATAQVSKGLIPKAEFDLKIKELADNLNALSGSYADKKSIDTLQSQIDKMVEKFEGADFGKKENKGFWSNILSKTADAVKLFNEKGKAVMPVELKSGPIDMGLTTAITGQVPQADREAGINYAPKRRPALIDVIGTASTSSNLVEWVEKTDEQGAPAYKREFEAAPLRSWKSIVRNLTMKKIMVAAEYSKEILNDVNYFQTELRRDLAEQITLQTDYEVLRGTTGGASDAGMKGILQYAQAWDNGTYGLPKANIFDVLRVAYNQVEKEHFLPNVIQMSPTTAMKLELTKDADGQYILPPFSSSNGTIVKGIPVITNTIFNDGEVLVMDGTRAQLVWGMNWEFEVTNSHGTNFLSDVITAKLTGRHLLKIKNTDAKAFVYIADVDTAIAALTSAS